MQGFEPRLMDPESCVLLLDDPPSTNFRLQNADSKPMAGRFLDLRFLRLVPPSPVSSTTRQQPKFIIKSLRISTSSSWSPTSKARGTSIEYPPTPLGAEALRCASAKASEGYPPSAKSAEAAILQLTNYFGTVYASIHGQSP